MIILYKKYCSYILSFVFLGRFLFVGKYFVNSVRIGVLVVYDYRIEGLC